MQNYAFLEPKEIEYSEFIKERLAALHIYSYEKKDQNEFQVAPIPEQYRIVETNAIYQGTWLNGKPHGKGKFFFSDGCLYEGYVTDGIPDKKGRKIFPNGDYYIGSFSLKATSFRFFSKIKVVLKTGSLTVWVNIINIKVLIFLVISKMVYWMVMAKNNGQV